MCLSAIAAGLEAWLFFTVGQMGAIPESSSLVFGACSVFTIALTLTVGIIMSANTKDGE